MILDKDIPLSPAEWQIWKDHPVTQRVFEALAAERSEWVQDLVFGRTLDVVTGSELKETAKTVGIIMGLTIVLEDFELKLQQQWTEAAERKAEMEEENES